MKVEMNEEWRKPWVEALRSGKYAQAGGALRSGEGEGFCCLGVLADICELGKWDFKNYYVVDGCRNDEILPTALAEIMGLGGETQRDLAKLNDDGESFEHIADIIESGEYAQAPLWDNSEDSEYDAIRGEE